MEWNELNDEINMYTQHILDCEYNNNKHFEIFKTF